ncbi:MAG: pyridoxamine 5'-phosphate oxidase family protein [Gemmatirosa sp.]
MHTTHTTVPTTTIRVLDDDAARALLRRHDVGRLAYAWHDRVDIEPIHYVCDEAGTIHARTSVGAKLLTLRHHPWVAFEVDEVRGLHDWCSVVVHGTVYELRADGPAHERAAYERALALLRTVDPATLTPDDPTPWRTVLFTLAVHELHGRAAHPPGDGHAG